MNGAREINSNQNTPSLAEQLSKILALMSIISSSKEVYYPAPRGEGITITEELVSCSFLGQNEISAAISLLEAGAEVPVSNVHGLQYMFKLQLEYHKNSRRFSDFFSGRYNIFSGHAKTHELARHNQSDIVLQDIKYLQALTLEAALGFDKAMPMYVELSLNKSAKSCLKMSQSHLESGDYEAAIAYLEQARNAENTDRIDNETFVSALFYILKRVEKEPAGEGELNKVQEVQNYLIKQIMRPNHCSRASLSVDNILSMSEFCLRRYLSSVDKERATPLLALKIACKAYLQGGASKSELLNAVGCIVESFNFSCKFSDEKQLSVKLRSALSEVFKRAVFSGMDSLQGIYALSLKFFQVAVAIQEEMKKTSTDASNNESFKLELEQKKKETVQLIKTYLVIPGLLEYLVQNNDDNVLSFMKANVADIFENQSELIEFNKPVMPSSRFSNPNMLFANYMVGEEKMSLDSQDATEYTI